MIRHAVLPVALFGLFAAGCARLGHDGVHTARPDGGHTPQHIATRGTIPPEFLDLVTTKKAFANLATVMPNGGPQVTPRRSYAWPHPLKRSSRRQHTW